MRSSGELVSWFVVLMWALTSPVLADDALSFAPVELEAPGANGAREPSLSPMSDGRVLMS